MIEETIINCLADGPMTCRDIALYTGLEVKTIRDALLTLEDAGVTRREGVGLHVLLEGGAVEMPMSYSSATPGEMKGRPKPDRGNGKGSHYPTQETWGPRGAVIREPDRAPMRLKDYPGFYGTNRRNLMGH